MVLFSPDIRSEIAPEVLLTAKIQRWPPDELLRTLVEAEIAARDAANARARLRAAALPATKTLDVVSAVSWAIRTAEDR